MPSMDQILTQNDHSGSFKVIRFGVNEEPLRGYIVQYNNYGLECKGSEDIASERSENRHGGRGGASFSLVFTPTSPDASFTDTPR